MQAHSRRAIVEHMTVGLQELVCEQVFAGFEHGIDGVAACARGPKVPSPVAQVNQKWLETVPFFRGMRAPGGRVVVPPVEKAFMSKVAVALANGVFAPMEQPPLGRLYVIMGGSVRYRGRARGPGYCWGALDVMLPNVGNVMPQAQAVALGMPLPAPTRRAMPDWRLRRAADYVHVSYIDGQTLRSIADLFPESLRVLRSWSMRRHHPTARPTAQDPDAIAHPAARSIDQRPQGVYAARLADGQRRGASGCQGVGAGDRPQTTRA